jgi:hypothetical protein
MQNETKKYNIILNDLQLNIIKNSLINDKNLNDEKEILIDIINEMLTHYENDMTKMLHDFTM